MLVATGEDAVALGHLEQLRTYGTPDRDPRMRVVSVAYVGFTRIGRRRRRIRRRRRAVLGASTTSRSTASAARTARRSRSTTRASIADGVERARAKLEYTTLATAFLDEPFTLGELRRVYEAVWGEPLHEGNFRRKVLVDARLRRTDRRDRAHRRTAGRALPPRRRAASASRRSSAADRVIGVYPGLVRSADDRAPRDRRGGGAARRTRAARLRARRASRSARRTAADVATPDGRRCERLVGRARRARRRRHRRAADRRHRARATTSW